MNEFHIRRASNSDIPSIAALAAQTFIASHGNSAVKADIDQYIAEKLNQDVLRLELSVPENLYYLIDYKSEPVGYSKIILHTSHPNLPVDKAAKLDRIYLLESHHMLGLGSKLFQFNVDLARAASQPGLWLYVWKGNQKALDFYVRKGFRTIGEYSFPLSERHSNPNFQLFLDLV